MTLRPGKVILSTHNKGKINEFNRLFASLDINFVSAAELGLTDVEETGLSFVENALLKARFACSQTGLPAIADDSGVEVDALDGAPGIYSARYAGEGMSSDAHIDKLLMALDGVEEEKRTARYQCIIVYMQHEKDPTPIIAQGTWEGRILMQRQGDGGFGYDPIFYLNDLKCSVAELSEEDKNHLSHRSKALGRLLEAFSSE